MNEGTMSDTTSLVLVITLSGVRCWLPAAEARALLEQGRCSLPQPPVEAMKLP